MDDWLDPLTNCRMVLCLPDADGSRVAALAARGVQAVGCLPAHVANLCAHRHKFDGAFVDCDSLAPEQAQHLQDGLDQAIAPGGCLVTRRDGRLDIERIAPQRLPIAPGLVVGACADLFTGCALVAELGAGLGAFLDALRLRAAACVGIERDGALLEQARQRGHEMHSGGLPALARLRDRRPDGIFLGNVVESVPPAALADLLATCRAVLAPRSRMVCRASRRFVEEELRGRAEAANGWSLARASTLPRDARDAIVLLIADATEPALPATIPDPPLQVAELSINQPPHSWFDLERFERRVTSQCGEDGVLAAIFARCGETNRSYVEFGCGNGIECNTREPHRQGWRGLLMDGAENPGAADVVIHRHWITPENINALLDEHDVPAEPDLMSIDLDGNDYWVWRAIDRRPRVIVAEYNGNLAADVALTIACDPEHCWDGTDYYGASLLALVGLAREKGYTLVYCSQSGVNAFFVRDDLIADEPAVDTAAIYRPANYWYRGGRSLPDLSRVMVEIG